mgnify:CR=1 FL=1
MRRHLLLLLSLIVLIAACGRSPVAFKSTDVTGAEFGTHLALADHHGKIRRLEDFRGKAIVLFFGYTACPDVCPTTLARYAEAMKALGPKAAKVQVLFVTLDPERDDADRLKTFVPWFHPDFIGLRGSPAEIAATAKEFRVHSAVKTVGGGMGYVLDHSAGSYVFDPAGRLRLYVRDTASVAEVVADLELLIAGH